MRPSLSPSRNVIPWRAQPGPQLTAIRHHNIDELFYGGAVGGGKSDYLLGDFAQDVPQPWGSHWHGILFRQTYGELEELISRSQEIYPPWFPGVEWFQSDKTWVWPNGATLKLRYLESTSDWMRYWGHQYGWIGWDELPNWADLTAYEKMKARLRSAHPIPNKRIRSTGNPGGRGHHAVKAYFKINEYPLGGVVFEGSGGMKRMFVRSRLVDNRVLVENDPNYGVRLAGLPRDMVRALLDGDWNVVAGAFFENWSEKRHVVRPFRIPSDWIRFRAMDWGSAAPFSVLWFAVATDDHELGDGRVLPRNGLCVYREWYGASAPNVGLKLTADEVAHGIAQRSTNEAIQYSVLDPAAFARDGGPSIAERMAEAERSVVFQRADNKRVSERGAMGGWDQVRQRLNGESETRPMLMVFDTCPNLIQHLPALQHDPDRMEDVDSSGEDHDSDACRYGCMSRPWAAPLPDKPKPILDWRSQTMDELWAEHERQLHRYD